MINIVEISKMIAEMYSSLDVFVRFYGVYRDADESRRLDAESLTGRILGCPDDKKWRIIASELLHCDSIAVILDGLEFGNCYEALFSLSYLYGFSCSRTYNMVIGGREAHEFINRLMSSGIQIKIVYSEKTLPRNIHCLFDSNAFRKCHNDYAFSVDTLPVLTNMFECECVPPRRFLSDAFSYMLFPLQDVVRTAYPNVIHLTLHEVADAIDAIVPVLTNGHYEPEICFQHDNMRHNNDSDWIPNWYVSNISRRVVFSYDTDAILTSLNDKFTVNGLNYNDGAELLEKYSCFIHNLNMLRLSLSLWKRATERFLGSFQMIKIEGNMYDINDVVRSFRAFADDNSVPQMIDALYDGLPIDDIISPVFR